MQKEIIKAFILQLFAFQSCYSLSDNALQSVLNLISLFLSSLKVKLCINELASVLSDFPSTLHLARKEIGILENTAKKFVTCPNCSSIYDPNACVVVERNGTKRSLECNFVKFPDHTQARMREKCGVELMKSVCSVDGKINYLYPKRVYCYQPV